VVEAGDEDLEKVWCWGSSNTSVGIVLIVIGAVIVAFNLVTLIIAPFKGECCCEEVC
jgi:hypothetical protein